MSWFQSDQRDLQKAANYPWFVRETGGGRAEIVAGRSETEISIVLAAGVRVGEARLLVETVAVLRDKKTAVLECISKHHLILEAAARAKARLGEVFPSGGF